MSPKRKLFFGGGEGQSFCPFNGGKKKAMQPIKSAIFPNKVSFYQFLSHSLIMDCNFHTAPLCFENCFLTFCVVV